METLQESLNAAWWSIKNISKTAKTISDSICTKSNKVLQALSGLRK